MGFLKKSTKIDNENDLETMETTDKMKMEIFLSAACDIEEKKNRNLNSAISPNVLPFLSLCSHYF